MWFSIQLAPQGTAAFGAVDSHQAQKTPLMLGSHSFHAQLLPQFSSPLWPLGDDSYPHILAAQRGVWNVLEKAVGRSCLGQIPTDTVITLARGKGISESNSGYQTGTEGFFFHQRDGSLADTNAQGVTKVRSRWNALCYKS